MVIGVGVESHEDFSCRQGGFRGRPGDDPFIQAARLRKIEPVLATHAAFLEQRERFAKQYVESEGGRQRTDALIEQVEVRAGANLVHASARSLASSFKRGGSRGESATRSSSSAR